MCALSVGEMPHPAHKCVQGINAHVAVRAVEKPGAPKREPEGEVAAPSSPLFESFLLHCRLSLPRSVACMSMVAVVCPAQW